MIPTPEAHIHLIDPAPIRRIRPPHRQLAGIVLRLRHAFSQFLVQSLGFEDAELGVAILQHVIRRKRLAAPPVAFEAAQRDRILAPDAAALDDTPARRFQCGVDVLGSGFGFVHGMRMGWEWDGCESWPVKAWCSSDFFNASSAASLRE